MVDNEGYGEVCDEELGPVENGNAVSLRRDPTGAEKYECRSQRNQTRQTYLISFGALNDIPRAM